MINSRKEIHEFNQTFHPVEFLSKLTIYFAECICSNIAQFTCFNM
jgi:hypothetical protein